MMRYCFQEAQREGYPLLLTTTTRLLKVARGPEAITGESGRIHIGPGIGPKLPLLWVGGDTAEGRKWYGPPMEALEAVLRASRNSSRENPRRTVLIEADGSAGRPVKAPGSGEPVIPPQVDTVAALLGLSALGRRVSRKTVHRLEYYLALSGCSPGDIITPELLCSLIVHQKGSFKGTLPGMRRLLILNQADSPEDLHLAEKIILLVQNMKMKSSESTDIFPETIVVSSFHPLHKINPIRSIASI